MLASGADVAAEEGARDAAAWLAHHARLGGGEARRSLRLAKACTDEWTGLAQARREGGITTAQAEIIRRAVEDLPAEVDDETRRLAEERLVAEAAQFGPHELRILGRRILHVVSPDAGEEHEQRVLERQEDHAERTTYLHTRRNGDGTTELRARVADPLATRLLTYLEAFTSPRRNPDDRRPYDQRLGSAFGALLEAIDPKRLPLHGRDATTVLVTVDLETLHNELGTGRGTALIGDEPITASQARRLACQAKIIPVVLGGASEVLDLGRSDRLYQPPQRKAMGITQPTCRAAGCDIPAVWCQAHHGGIPWAQGGRTDLADGILLCPFHHHRAHDHHYDLQRHPDGRVTFHRKT